MAYLRILSLAALAVVLCLGGEPSARDLAKQARKAEKKKEFASAYLLWSQAAAKDPSKRDYWQRAQALQRRAASSANVMPTIAATPPPPRILKEDPPPEPPAASIEELIESRKPLPPIEIRTSAARRDIDIRGDSQILWEQTAKLYDLDVVFDGDYQAGAPTRFRMTGADYREALHALMTLTSSFIVPISERVMLVVKDTEAKRREVENTVAFSVPIPDPFTIQEAQELGRSVQQVMEIQRFAIDSAQRVAIFRDRVSKAYPAKLLFQQLLGSRAQVMIEVELLSAGKTRSTQLGLNIPTTFPLLPLQKVLTLKDLAWPEFALTISSARLIANANQSEIRTLYRAQMRALDSQASQLHVGEKYPIVSMNFIGDTTGAQPGTIFSPPPTFNFEDLGLNLKLTPKVHDAEEVTFDVEAEFKLLGAGSLNGIPVISNRKFATRVRLRFDEAAIISGLVTQNDVRTLSGPAGLLNIPVLGGLLGQTDRTKDDIQVLLSIRPVLLTAPPTEASTRPIWTGTEVRNRIPM